MKKVAILIPVYNNIEFTKKCLQKLDESISGHSFPNSEFLVIVIDDGSTDGTGEWLSVHYPQIHVLNGDGNLWWSGGVNVGATYAIGELGAEYILLWNNDIIHETNYFVGIDKLVKELDDRTIAGSKIFYSDRENIIWSFGGIFNPKNGVKYMVGYNLPDSDQFTNSIPVDWLPGMGTLVPVQVINEIGMWDAETFPQYHGDSDFTFRARRAGFKIIAYPELILWNDKSSSGVTHGGTLKGLIKSLTSIRGNYNIRKNFLFYKRHATSLLAYRVLISYYFRVIAGFFKWKFLSLFGIRKNT